MNEPPADDDRSMPMPAVLLCFAEMDCLRIDWPSSRRSLALGTSVSESLERSC